jgi:chemotaxis protein MotB
MAKAHCKCKPTECEECPEWIFTFADLVMLMMGFFVILWVLKPAPGEPGKPQQDLPIEVLAAIREAFGHLPDPQSKDPVDVHILMKKLEKLKPMLGPGEGGKTRVKPEGVQGTDPEVEMIRAGKQVGTGTKVLFTPADATLSVESQRSLTAIADLIRGHRNIFMVKGHASSDDYPDGTDESVKMALSLKRAQAAADYLVTKGVDRETIRVQGCSTYEPVIQRAYTGDARSQNRRVEVEATGTLVKEMQGSAKPNAAGTIAEIRTPGEGQ